MVGDSHSAQDKILVIEDDELIRISIVKRLEAEGYQVLESETGEGGLAVLEQQFIDLVLTDYQLPDVDGLTIIKRIAGQHDGQVVIMMTAHGSVDIAVDAMRNGAYSYLKKPVDFFELVEDVKRGLEATRLRREVDRLKNDPRHLGGKAPMLVGHSPAMHRIEELIKKLNESGTSTALILGGSGTGKNVIAKRLHYTSPRADQPFMTVTCTDFTESLLESELFGHQKGAFTGAHTAKTGLFEVANGGTIFLDEIGDMPLSLQAKLLRFLEERTFRRVGGTQEISIDVRIVAATNKDLMQLVKEGTFREDLYYRLAVIPIEIPPLNERKEDIVDLARLFVDKYGRQFRKPIKKISDAASEALVQHSWPGNVRELRNVIERALIITTDDQVGLEDLPTGIGQAKRETAPSAIDQLLQGGGIDLAELEKKLIERALELNDGNQSAAARMLNLSRDQIRYRMDKFHLD